MRRGLCRVGLHRSRHIANNVGRCECGRYYLHDASYNGDQFRFRLTPENAHRLLYGDVRSTFLESKGARNP